MCQQTRKYWILAQIMVCRLLDAEALSGLSLVYCKTEPFGNRLQWNLNQNTTCFKQVNAFENVSKMAVILSMGQCDNVRQSGYNKIGMSRAAHYSDVIMGTVTSQITSQPHDCFLNRLFKENIKAPRHWPLCRELTGHRWIPCTKGQ